MNEVIHCETVLPASATPRPHEPSHKWVAWPPLILLPALTIAFRAKLVPWAFMWLLAALIFAGCKWLTWWEASSSGVAKGNWKRSAAYFLLWPGMEPREFFAVVPQKRGVSPNVWLASIAKTLAGLGLIWSGARLISLGHPLLAGWVGMVGIVLVLHFGMFHLLALAWQHLGIPVKPIMQQPLMSNSLSSLWGRRWNLGFRALSHTWVFRPLQKSFGPAVGILGAFFASGLLHDLVISVPARAGFGLPTAYFVLQGFGVIAERSETGKRCGLGHGVAGRLWTALVSLGPLCALFHPWFVVRVIDPFLGAIAG